MAICGHWPITVTAPKPTRPDFELCIVRLGRDFKTKRGGSGKLIVKETIGLRDPNRKAGFAIVNEDSAERRLTGADFDPESLVVRPDGDFWVGEEFGPFVLHFASEGALLQAPVPLPGIASPDDPLGRPANIKRSKGFEGMARDRYDANADTFRTLLEGPVEGDDPRTLRAYPLYADIPQFQGYIYYQLEDPTYAIGELARLPNGKHLVIERDNFQGDEAKFKKNLPNRFREKPTRTAFSSNANAPIYSKSKTPTVSPATGHSAFPFRPSRACCRSITTALL